MPSVMVTAGKREDKPPRDILTPRRVRYLASVEKDMYTTQIVIQKPVSYMVPEIHQMNARSWETLVISMLKSDLMVLYFKYLARVI